MKKIIKIIGTIMGVAILFLNVSLSHKTGSVNIDLLKIIKANKADAECIYNEQQPYFNDGECWEAAQTCMFRVDSYECDPRIN